MQFLVFFLFSLNIFFLSSFGQHIYTDFFLPIESCFPHQDGNNSSSIELRVNPYMLVCKYSENMKLNCANPSKPNKDNFFLCWPLGEFRKKPQFHHGFTNKTIVRNCFDPSVFDSGEHHAWGAFEIEIVAFQVDKKNSRYKKQIFLDVAILLSYSEQRCNLKRMVYEYDVEFVNTKAYRDEVSIFELNFFDGGTPIGFTTLRETHSGIVHGKVLDFNLAKGARMVEGQFDQIALAALDIAATGSMIKFRLVLSKQQCNIIKFNRNDNSSFSCNQQTPNRKATGLRADLGDTWYEALKEIMPQIRKYSKLCLLPLNPPPPDWAIPYLNATIYGTDEKEEDGDASLLFGGDVILTSAQARKILEQIKSQCDKQLSQKHSSRNKRQAVFNRWPSSRIHYSFAELDLKNAADQKQWCLQAMATIQSQTCLTFLPRSDGDDHGFIDFRFGRPECEKVCECVERCADECETKCPSECIKNRCTCSATVGYDSGSFVQLSGCWSPGTVIHELGHTFGLHHEQNRYDRDNYVWNGKPDRLWKLSEKNSDNLGQPYDYGSIMHYNGFITLLRPYMHTQGHNVGEYSFKDLKMFNYLYCYASCSGKLDRCLNGGYLDPNDCNKCTCPDGYGGQICESVKESDDICGSKFGELFVGSANKIHTFKFTLHTEGTCYWRIWPKSPMNRVNIIVRKLSGFHCDGDHRCGSENGEFLEIKYRKEKTATGARYCCPENHDHSIDAEDDTDILLILKSRGNKLEIHLEYSASGGIGLGQLTESCSCSQHPYYFFIKERNPDQFYNYWYGKEAKCIEEHGPDYLGGGVHHKVEAYCRPPATILLNGKYHDHPLEKVISSYSHTEVPNESLIRIKCMKTKNGSSLWIYADDEFGIIPVDELICVGNAIN